MIGIVIADDEQIIRDGLVSVPWSSIDVEVRGVCCNGADALETAIETDSRILLTDIRMPGMNGLELIQKIKNEYPKIKTILLSGYSDFEYARSAISSSAIGYILKPSEPEEILKVVSCARDKIMSETKLMEAETKLGKQIEENIKTLRDKFLLDIMYGNVSDTLEIYDGLKNLNIALNSFSLIFLELKEHDTFTKSYKSKGNMMHFQNMVEEAFLKEHSGYVIELNHYTLCIICKIPEHSDMESHEIESLLNQLLSTIKGKMDLDVLIGLTEMHEGIDNLNRAFNEAIYWLSTKFALSSGIVHIHNVPKTAEILTNSEKNLNTVVGKVLGYINSKYMDDITLTTCADYVHLNPVYLTRLIRKNTGETFIDIVTRVRLTKAGELLKNTDLKINEVAEMVGIYDSRYFSQVFKKHFGVTPSECRHSISINKGSDGEIK